MKRKTHFSCCHKHNTPPFIAKLILIRLIQTRFSDRAPQSCMMKSCRKRIIYLISKRNGSMTSDKRWHQKPSPYFLADLISSIPQRVSSNINNSSKVQNLIQSAFIQLLARIKCKKGGVREGGRDVEPSQVFRGQAQISEEAPAGTKFTNGRKARV